MSIKTKDNYTKYKDMVRVEDRNGMIVLIENGIEYDFLDATRDGEFKNYLRKDKDYVIVRALYKELFGIEPDNIEEKNNGFIAHSIISKKEEVDYCLKVDKDVVIFECNRVKSKVLEDRNISHLRRAMVDNSNVVQINCDNYSTSDSDEISTVYKLVGDHGENLYENLVKIVRLNLSKLRERIYNKDIKTLSYLEKVLSVFVARHREILDRVVEGDEELMKIRKIPELVLEETDLDKYTKEELTRMVELHNEREEGINKGSYEKAFETARNMIEKGIDLDPISECTGLSLEEIGSLK